MTLIIIPTVVLDLKYSHTVVRYWLESNTEIQFQSQPLAFLLLCMNSEG